MSSVQKRFFTAVVAVTGICLIASVAASAWVKSTQRQNIDEAERSAQNLLSEASERLLSDTDAEVRITEASQLAQDAVFILRTSAQQSGMIRLLSSVLPSSSKSHSPSAALAQRAQTFSDALIDVADVLPVMKRLAGYDAASDVSNAAGSRDLYLRLYTARDGLQKTISQLDTLPLSERFEECRTAAGFARIAFAETEPLLMALESGIATVPDATRFVTAAHAASQHASQAVGELLSEESLQHLAELAQ